MKEDGEIEVTSQPIKKIVIFECNELSLHEFFQRMELVARSGAPLMLNWAEGIIFLPFPYNPNSDIIVEETLKGTFYWSTVMFSVMPEYVPLKKFGAREVPIIDQTSIPYFKQVAQWLKKKSKNI